MSHQNLGEARAFVLRSHHAAVTALLASARAAQALAPSRASHAFTAARATYTLTALLQLQLELAHRFLLGVALRRLVDRVHVHLQDTTI